MDNKSSYASWGKISMAVLKITLIWLVCLWGVLLYGEDLTGREIMEEAFNRYDGDDAYFKMEMKLVDKKGNERKRLLEIYTKDYGNLIKTFIKFIFPPDIEGVSFLSWENQDKEDTQYLYLPALGRVRRIVSTQKNLRFVNTDFTYEDMQRRRPEQDTHTLLRESSYKDYNCFVVESIPKKGSSQYSKRISWVGKDNFVILKIEFYNKKGKKIKEYRIKELKKIAGIWTPTEVIMEDLIDGHRTLMKTLKVKYNQGVDDAIFSIRHLQED